SRAGAGDEEPAGPQHPERPNVQLAVGAQRRPWTFLPLRQTRRVKHHGVEALARPIELVKNVEGVRLPGLDLSPAVALDCLRQPACGHWILFQCQDRVAARGKGQGESSVVAEGVQRPPPAELAGAKVVLRLVEEGAGLHVPKEIGAEEAFPLAPL